MIPRASMVAMLSTRTILIWRRTHVDDLANGQSAVADVGGRRETTHRSETDIAIGKLPVQLGRLATAFVSSAARARGP